VTRGRASRRTPVVITLVVGLMLSIMPLPESIRMLRPDWLALLMIFWAIQLPRTWSVGSAWIVGLVLDVAQGTILGQHALSLCFIVFITVRFHLLMRVFPMQQLTATVFAILTLYQFILFWINGVAGVDVPLVRYWGPVLTGTLLWPIITMVLSGVRMRVQHGR
jgi:rod shape-determining protein MreD